MIRHFLTQVTRTFIGLRYRFGKQQSVIDIVQQLRQAQKVLIYMPNRRDHFEVALNSLQLLRTQNPMWQLTLIVRQEVASLVHGGLKAKVITHSREDHNLFGLPKSSLRRRFKDSTYDLALDLNFTLDPLAPKLFSLSKAPLKVCFDSREKSGFYNFGIRVKTLDTLESKYNAIIKYVSAVPTQNHDSQTKAV